MTFSLIVILEAAILAGSLSLDAFTAGFAYGSNKIKIPFLSVQVINIICSSILGIALLVGSIISGYIPSWITTVICFIILFTIGTIKLLDSITKSIIRKYNNLNKELKFSFLNFKFILNLYANPEDADIDSSKILSIREAIALAISLSLDGLAVGFGAALTNVNGVIIFFFSFLTNTLAVLLGCNIGNKLAAKISFNLSWLSGIVLIVLAFLKLL